MWVIEIILLVFLLCLPIKKQENNSNIVSLAVFSFVGMISYKYGVLIFQTNANIPLTRLQSWLQMHQDVMLFAWYFGFYVFNIIAMSSIYLLHKKYALPNGTITETIMLAYLVDGLLKLTRLSERYLFETDYLQALYRWGIPGINVAVLLVAFIITVKTSHQYHQYKLRLT